jgi:hypothetical protein
MLSIQQVGDGQLDDAMLGGMVNLAVNPCTNAWENLELKCSKHEISLGEEMIGENLDTEIKLSKEQGNPRTWLHWHFCPGQYALGQGIIRMDT